MTDADIRRASQSTAYRPEKARRVFDLFAPNNLVRVVKGDNVGTLVTG
jgi:hypothetical protein